MRDGLRILLLIVPASAEEGFEEVLFSSFAVLF
jgi:hypothetical protein